MVEDVAVAVGFLAVLWLMERGGRRIIQDLRGRRISAHPSHAFRRPRPRR